MSDVVFDKRLRKIVRNRRRLNQGVVTKLRADGLIVARPKLVHFKVSLKGPLLLLLSMTLCKAYFLMTLGKAGYQERLATLAEGNIYEQAGAWVLFADPATVWLAQFMATITF